MGVSPDYLQATVVICDAALEYGHLEVVVNMSQMTVSQMTLTSVGESHQHRLHYFAEHVLNWSAVPVVHIRPTAFLDNPMFTWFAAPSLRERNVLALPFGTGRTSPIATSDVARTVAAVLVNPAHRIGEIYELTGPASKHSALAVSCDLSGDGAVSWPTGKWLDVRCRVRLGVRPARGWEAARVGRESRRGGPASRCVRA